MRVAVSPFEQCRHETTQVYALRFRKLLTRFESAVERWSESRTPWSAFAVYLWENDLKPSIRCQQFPDKLVTSLTEVIDRARRIEAAGMTGDTVSSLSFTRVPNSRTVKQLSLSTGGASAGGKRAATGPRSDPRPARRAGNLVCTYRGCTRPNTGNHSTETCFDRLRAEEHQQQRQAEDTPAWRESCLGAPQLEVPPRWWQWLRRPALQLAPVALSRRTSTRPPPPLLICLGTTRPSANRAERVSQRV